MVNQELIRQIEQKEKELLYLNEQLDKEKQEEKDKVMKAKSEGMTKSLYLLGFEFESSPCRTAQYLEFHQVFKREFKKLLNPYCSKIEIGKPNHFDISGFFELKDGRIYYFYLGDLRWYKANLLIRTAKDFKDYTGGSNDYISIDQDLGNKILRYLKN